MDAVEEWLRERADDIPGDAANMPMTHRDVCIGLAQVWSAKPPVALIPYEAPSPLADFLEHVEGPAMIGLDPVIYPACVRCNQPWMMRRSRGAWAWFPDCSHKSATCKLVKA